MAKQFKPETLCVQAGWTPKKGEPVYSPFIKAPLSNMKPASNGTSFRS